MLRKFIAPIAILATILIQVTIYNLNANDISQHSEVGQDYFIKPIPQSSVVVVEPNYGRFFNPDPTIEKDRSGAVLYTALDELEEKYNIGQTKMVSFERKGQVVPNLYIHVDEKDFQPNLEGLPSDELLAEQPS